MRTSYRRRTALPLLGTCLLVSGAMRPRASDRPSDAPLPTRTVLSAGTEAGAVGSDRKAEAGAPAPAAPTRQSAVPAKAGAGQEHSGHGSPSAPPAAPPAPSATSWFAHGGGLYAPPYYDAFQGLDIAPLSAAQRERFLHWVNTEFCTCAQKGCTRDTIANCYTNDSKCPRAPERIREILAKVKSGAPPPGAAIGPPPMPAPGN